MACFCRPAELAYAEEFDVETEGMGGGLGYAFNCLVLVLVIRKGVGSGTDIFTLRVAC
jgi:Na+-transporting NADH:ubiquinone oxidoreductase subunit NqrD